MSTVTKKELIDRIADATGVKRVVVKKIVQSFLDNVIVELGRGNRLEFRDFGVFEVKHRAARIAQNPKTLKKVKVPPKQTVKFKPGRLMKQTMSSAAEAMPVDADDPNTPDSTPNPGSNPANPGTPPNPGSNPGGTGPVI